MVIKKYKNWRIRILLNIKNMEKFKIIKIIKL